MISTRELEILNILFSSDDALSSSDIVQAKSKLSQSTVQAVLRKLLREGLVSVEGKVHSGNVLSRTFKPTEAARELIKKQYIDSYDTIKHIVSIDEIIQEFSKRYNE